MNAPLTATAIAPGRQRRGGLVQEVVQHLQQLIQTGQLKAGDKLPTESAVMGALGMLFAWIGRKRREVEIFVN